MGRTHGPKSDRTRPPASFTHDRVPPPQFQCLASAPHKRTNHARSARTPPAEWNSPHLVMLYFTSTYEYAALAPWRSRPSLMTGK